MAKPHGHPIFAAVYDRLTRSTERKVLGAHRAWLCARAGRRVLDLGAGTGANFPYVRGSTIPSGAASRTS